jgi:capsular polysaccharide biosynthesis protein
MEVRRYLSIVRRRFFLVILIVAAGLTAGWLITPRDTEYTATSTLYVGSRSIDVDPTSGELSNDRFLGLDRLIATFSSLVKSRPIAVDAIEEADVERAPRTVVANTTATQVPGTNLLQVSVSDRDAITAQVLANSVAESFVAQINDLERQDTETLGDVVSVYERARTPTTADPTDLIRNMLLAGLFGLVVAGAVLALLEHLDITVRSAEDIERRLELPVLGIVPALGDRIPVTPAAAVSTLPTVRQGTTRSRPVG